MNYKKTIEKWKVIMNNWELSNQSIADFCKENDLDKSTFYQWRKRLPTSDNHSFVAIKPMYQHPTSNLVLELPGAVRIEVNNSTDFELLSRLLKAIGGNS